MPQREKKNSPNRLNKRHSVSKNFVLFSFSTFIFSMFVIDSHFFAILSNNNNNDNNDKNLI